MQKKVTLNEYWSGCRSTETLNKSVALPPVQVSAGSHLVTPPHVQRAAVYERRVAAPLQPAHRPRAPRSIHPQQALRSPACRAATHRSDKNN